VSHLRAASRLTALCVITFVAYILLVAGLVLTLAFRRARTRWRGFIFRKWAKAATALLKIRIATSGVPPQAPFFLVSNHLSYVDILVLASQLGCSFIAKKDVSRWPVIGLLCRAAGTIFIDRKNRRSIITVNAKIERAFADGSGIVLFAEGTSTSGAGVLPFKPSLLEPAARAGLAVSYAAVSYRTPGGETPTHLAVCWWGDMTFVKHLSGLFHLREIEATLAFGPETIRDADRKRLAGRLHDGVKRQFIPVVRSEEEWSAVIL
jgi:1-acyl-sn-glycerol-3-phosphate acyltransferase